MAILAIFTGKGFTKEHYEGLRKEIKWEQNHPIGAIFHAASFDDKGDAHVADVWASPEEMNQFVNSRLMPAMKKLNIPPPTVEVFPAYNVNAYPAIDKYKLK